MNTVPVSPVCSPARLTSMQSENTFMSETKSRYTPSYTDIHLVPEDKFKDEISDLPDKPLLRNGSDKSMDSAATGLTGLTGVSGLSGITGIKDLIKVKNKKKKTKITDKIILEHVDEMTEEENYVAKELVDTNVKDLGRDIEYQQHA